MTIDSDDEIRSLLQLLDRNLQSIWEGDIETYRQTTAEDVSFYEWFISPQRIDGIEFHLRELPAYRQELSSGGGARSRIEHEVLQPRVQRYGDTAIISYTLLIRMSGESGTRRTSHHETRVFHNFGTENEPDWKLVHCHKSPVATQSSLSALRT